MKANLADAVEIRPFVAADEPDVLELLTASLGGGPVGRRVPEFFRWKHLDNPFGASFMLVATAGDRIVGLRAFMRWRFRAGDATLSAVRAVDTATHPDFQGGGIFSRLTLQALDALRGEVDFVFNTPNAKSLPGYLKMGWRIVGRMPVWLRVRRPVRLVRGARSLRQTVEATEERPAIGAETAAVALADPAPVAALLDGVDRPGPRLATARDPAFLRWRYAAAPHFDYRAVREERDGRLDGIALFRVRARGSLWETTVAELIARDRRTARRLLRRAAHAARVDHVTASFPAGSPVGSGFLRSPMGMTFVANPLREGIRPDPARMDSWALGLGDLEVF